MPRVIIRYYSSLRDEAGREVETVYLDEGACVNDLVVQTISRFPQIEKFESSLLIARNSEYVNRNVELADGDIIDLMPPVSGG